MKEIVGLSHVYYAYESNVVLEDIGLSILEGDYLGIVGPNGSAKSTLLKLMLKILTPLRGEIKLFGIDIKEFRNWGKIGYVAQKAASFNTAFPATVEEIVSLNLYPEIGILKPIKSKHMKKVEEALEVVDMKGFKNRTIGNLSGGQQQKVFIARALVSSPQIIFLDEPTVGIDAKSQEEFYELMDRLNREMNITIVMVSHDIGVITAKAKRVVCMGDNRLIIHSTDSNIPLSNILNEFYGDKMRLLKHEH